MDGLWDEDGGAKPAWEVLLVSTPAGLLARATDWLETLPKGLERQGVVLCESNALRERLRGASAALLASGGGDRQPRGAEPEVFEAETRRLGLWSRLRPPSPGLRGSAP